jgi:hypothetical protein
MDHAPGAVLNGFDVGEGDHIAEPRREIVDSHPNR